MKKIQLVGIPYDRKSSFMSGPAKAPDRIRKVLHNGASNYYSENGTIIGPEVYIDHGNLLCSVYEDIYNNTLELLKEYNLPPLFLGGDHSITYPIVNALKEVYGEFNMLHIDAHADLYEEYEGDRFSHACPMARIMEEKLVLTMTQVGIRTLNEHQRAQARKYHVNIIEMKDWVDQEIDLQGPLYISLDMDAFDPAFAPGVSHHEPGGFSTRQVLRLIQQINVPLIGADIVEYNPTRDINDITAALAAKMLKELAAKIIS